MLKNGAVVRGSAGSYKIIKQLSKGGMGIVHLARSDSGQEVVIKEPRRDNPEQADINVEKLRVERDILKNLNHPHVVKYVDWIPNEDSLVIEYVDGAGWDKLFAGKRLSAREAKSHILQVLDALAYIHGKNVIYRDLKPHNILTNRQNVSKLIDFGGAKFFHTQLADPRIQHTQIFTPGWAAPEQMWGGASFQADIYSAGAVLFFLLTGECPGLYMDAKGHVEPPINFNPAAGHLSDVVVKAMDPDPNKRYQTVGDMIKDVKGEELKISDVPHIIYGNSRFEIRGEIMIGRAEDCDVKIDDPMKFVSKYHARVFMQGGKFWVEDLGSLNGTFIGQAPPFKRLTPGKPVQLKDNDLIVLCYHDTLGPYVTLKFKMAGG
jgi:serine/threonine protein kinase